PNEEPLPFWRSDRGVRLAALLHPRSLRYCLLHPFQVQPAPHPRLPELAGILDGSLPTTRDRRNGELRAHQAPLLHDARRDQPDAHRADWSRTRPYPPARPREVVGDLSQDPGTLG